MISADRVGGWKNHYARMIRWQERACSALDDLPNTDFHDALDTALAYFVWCHSLRDWLIKDSALNQNDIDNQLAKHITWKIVRDLANRSKHLKITQNPLDSEWSVSREYDPFAITLEGKERHHMNLYFDGDKYRLRDIIKRSGNMWQQVFIDTQLIINSTDAR